MNVKETAFTFDVDDEKLMAILHKPDHSPVKTGLLIIVGGPQYRIGAHRQYVHMARHCAALGIPVMRFDYRGVGDSEGDYPGFENITPDIHAALDRFLKECPQLDNIAIWGLCEGASAILLGGCDHKAVKKIILVNPWVRTESGQAKAMVKHYYLQRLKSPDFWKKIFSGKFKLFAAFSGFMTNLWKTVDKKDNPSHLPQTFPERMLSGFRNFNGKSLLIQSGKDLTAREFDDLLKSSPEWHKLISEKLSLRVDLDASDHTFSREQWRQQVAKATSDWILSADS